MRERDHVQRDVAPAHRELGAVDQADAGLARGFARLGESGDLVVVGQREDVHAARCRARGRARPGVSSPSE